MTGNFYTELARRMHVSRDLVKRLMYVAAYGGSVDPWILHILLTELKNWREESEYLWRRPRRDGAR